MYSSTKSDLLSLRVLLSAAIFRPIIGRIMESKTEEKV